MGHGSWVINNTSNYTHPPIYPSTHPPRPPLLPLLPLLPTPPHPPIP
ncbi:MAG: hypothetical protein QNJ46_25440 [Leptolyngbyaceae cyanobacterium MO_188.B28]|nr:hypothetical protein [Leptolyngbyaceae cyanobacterium MO_188.B28]